MIFKPLCIFLFVLVIHGNLPPQTGNSDYAIYFTGELGHILISDLITNHPTEAVTVAFWIRLDPPGTSDGEGGTPYNTGSATTDGELSLIGTSPFQLIIGGTYADNAKNIDLRTDYLCVIRWSSSTGHIEAFVNWEQIVDKQANNTIGMLLDKETWLLMGQDSDTSPPSPPWDENNIYFGYVDEVMLWNRTVELDELKALYQQNALVLSSSNKNGLVAYWPFSEGTGLVAKDVISGWNLWLGGGDGKIADFKESAVPLWVKSPAPFLKNRVTASYITNQNTLIELPFSDPDGDPVSITLTSLPSKGVLYEFVQGTNTTGASSTQIGLQIKQIPKVLNNTNKLWYFSNTNVSAQNRIYFSYNISDGKSQVSAQVSLQSNSPPVAYPYSNTTNEDTLTTITLFAHDPDEDHLVYQIVSLPENGQLFHFGTEQQVQVGDNITDENWRVLYLPSADQYGPNLSSFRFQVNDGVYVSQAQVTISVLPVSDPPTTPVLTLVTEEDTPVVISFASVIDKDPTDYIVLKYITQLPTTGKLFQYGDQTGKGSQISDVGNQGIEIQTQFGSRVLNFSTHFNDKGRWSANSSLGPADCPFGYCDATAQHDCDHAWSAETESDGIDGYGLEFLEVEIETPLFLTGVQVYENLAPGAVFKVEALVLENQTQSEITSTDTQVDVTVVNGIEKTVTTTVITTTYKNLSESSELIEKSLTKELIWEGQPAPVAGVARVFNPKVCATGQQVYGVRISMNTSAVLGWNEVDAIGVLGSLEQNPRGLVIGGKSLLFEPSPDWNGHLVIEYNASDCSGKVSNSQIQITVTPVNDAPRILNSSTQMEATLFQTNILSLDAYDVENDSMTWFVVELPAVGLLLDPSTEAQITTTEYQLPNGQVLYLSNKNNPLQTSFKWRVQDSQRASSQVGSTQINLQCPAGFTRENQNGEDICRICPSGTFSTSLDSKTCNTCPTGFKSNAGSSECVENVLEITSAARGVVLGFSIACIVYAVTILVLLVAMKNHNAIRASNFTFCVIILLGGLSVCVSVLIASMEGNVHCYLPPWFLGIGLSVSFSAIVVKNWHVYALFNMKGLDPPTITKTQLAGIVGLVTLPTVAILIAWQKIEGGFGENIELNSKNYIKTCSSDHQWVFRGLLYAYNGFLLILCLGIAIMTRNVRSQFNESKLLGLSIYNISLCSLLAAVVNSLLKANPTNQFVVTQLVILFGIFSTLTIFFGYKFYRCLVRPDSNTNTNLSGRKPTGTSGSSRRSQSDAV